MEPRAPGRPNPIGWAFIVHTRLSDTFTSKFSLAFLTAMLAGFRFTHMAHGWLPKLLAEDAKHVAAINQSLTGVFVPMLLSVFGNRSRGANLTAYVVIPRTSVVADRAYRSLTVHTGRSRPQSGSSST
ncbi:MAG: hypothetical protein BGO25_20545 [Acidobacteriales bacterium 59-55]|nr:MAG: hypothetical protein BGO25_20545 [Acidobacteriales bacterium 59-55]